MESQEYFIINVFLALVLGTSEIFFNDLQNIITCWVLIKFTRFFKSESFLYFIQMHFS